jgi:NDP-sugar pyrophosphorylase family protein
MKAMILAAGLGTRLRPLTDDRPKALVEVAGRTLLEIALARLRAFGVRDVIVNAHHHAEMIVDYLKAHNNFGMRVEVSREEELLDTGGGLRKAAHFFLEDGGSGKEPFILHNVDVLSTIDLGRMARFHAEQGALATLAVQERESVRQLLFDEEGQLCGRRVGQGPWSPRSPNARDLGHPAELVPSVAEARGLSFCGIHVISPRIFGEMEEDGAFSIINAYLRLAAQGERVVAFRADVCYWRDLGRPESVVQAARDFADGKYILA